jgi:class 3 adenylate cyclase
VALGQANSLPNRPIAKLDTLAHLRNYPAKPCEAAMDVGGWLRGLNLGRHEKKFRESKIDFDVLADLTDGDLQELGLPLGDRKRLLKAIAELRSQQPLAIQAGQAPAPPAPAQSFAQLDSAERRPITVMFCDLVGSTELAAALDVEDWRNLLNSYLDEASRAVTALGGHVLKMLGDGMMAVFGYPRAQENDAERAVRTALAIQRALGELNARNAAGGAPELKARIGIESGPVVVEATGEVFGEAPNIAARVQAAAEPGTVLVTSTVLRQVAGLFIVEDKGAHELKGAPAPVTLYRILRISGGRRRRGARLLTSFVGREEDPAILARCSRRAFAGAGQFVLIVGEPGIGKSRLVEEFRGQLADRPHSWIEWSASQLLQNTPLHPVLGWARARFGGPEVAPERRLAELESLLAAVKLDPATYAPLLAPLVDIPIPPERLPSLSPEEIRRRQLAAMVEWAMAGARNQPLVLVLEDLQCRRRPQAVFSSAMQGRGAASRAAATRRANDRGDSLLGLVPVRADMRLHQPVERRARERLDETVDHRLLENLGRTLGVICADLNDKFVVQPANQASIYAGLKQPIVDVSEGQHRGVGASALNRQIAAAGVERLAFGNAALGVNSPDFSVGVLADYDA